MCPARLAQNLSINLEDEMPDLFASLQKITVVLLPCMPVEDQIQAAVGPGLSEYSGAGLGAHTSHNNCGSSKMPSLSTIVSALCSLATLHCGLLPS